MKSRPTNESKETQRVISSLWTVLEKSMKAQIEGFDTDFYILNESVYLMDAELSYVVLKSWRKCSFVN